MVSLEYGAQGLAANSSLHCSADNLNSMSQLPVTGGPVTVAGAGFGVWASRHRHRRELRDCSFRAARKTVVVVQFDMWQRGSKNTRLVWAMRIKLVASPLSVAMVSDVCRFDAHPFAHSELCHSHGSELRLWGGTSSASVSHPHQAVAPNWLPSDHLSGWQTCLLGIQVAR